MPNRPPREWFSKAVRSIQAKRPEVTDPAALAGWVWHYEMSPSKKAEAVRGEYDPNPITSAVMVLPLNELIKEGLAVPTSELDMRRTGHMPVNDPRTIQRTKLVARRPSVGGRVYAGHPLKSTGTIRSRGRGPGAIQRAQGLVRQAAPHVKGLMSGKGIQTPLGPILATGAVEAATSAAPDLAAIASPAILEGLEAAAPLALLDPDHLGDLIEDLGELRERMIERDRWIDEEYGPLDERYANGEYHPRKRRHDPQPEENVNGLMSVEEFRKNWADPNKRYQLRKLKAIYDPKRKRTIKFVHNLKKRDPKGSPEPIDIYGYGDKESASMLRLVPEVHGLRPVDLEGMNPYRGGTVNITPAGSLVEMQVKFPSHLFNNDILPRMIDDPTNEIDLEHGRIVRRGKNNLGTNLFIDSD